MGHRGLLRAGGVYLRHRAPVVLRSRVKMHYEVRESGKMCEDGCETVGSPNRPEPRQAAASIYRRRNRRSGMYCRILSDMRRRMGHDVRSGRWAAHLKEAPTGER